jgi:hypothetical protein
MTVSSTLNRKTFSGDGASTVFDTSPIEFFGSSDLAVYVVTNTTHTAVTLVEGTHYSVSGGSGAGVVTLAGGASPWGPLLSGTTLVIVRDLDLVQEADFVNNEINDAEVQEDALDKLTMMAQQLNAKIARSVALPDSDTSGTSTVLPFPSGSNLLGWNSAGTGLQNFAPSVITAGTTVSAFMATMLDDANQTEALATLGASILGFTTPEQFGAVGDGIADDTAAMQLALDDIRDNGGVLSLSSGTYKITAPITLQRTSSVGPEQYIIEGNGSTLSFASAGLGVGALFTVGAVDQASGHDTGFIRVSDLRIIGPETGTPFSGDTPGGDTIGMWLEFAFNITLSNVYVQGCYVGMKTHYTFPLRAHSIELKSNYVGLYVEDLSTLAEWYGLSVTSARYGLLLRPEASVISSQHFVNPRFEQCMVGAVMDPRSGAGAGARGVVFDNPYVEDITYDVFRIGLQWTFADPATRNADATRDIWWVCIHGGGLWSDTWTGTHASLVLPSISSVKGIFATPAAEAEVVGNLTHCAYRANFNQFAGDGAAVTARDNAVSIRPQQPAFSAHPTAQYDNVTGDGTAYDITCGTENFDVMSDHSTGTGLYTARFTGMHLLRGKVFMGGLIAGHTGGVLSVVTTLRIETVEFNPYAISNVGEAMAALSDVFYMVAGDTAKIRVQVSGSTKVVDVKIATEFSGYFLG